MDRRNFIALAALAAALPAHASLTARKVSLYGDSVTAGRGYAQTMVARAAGRISAVTDYSRGGNTLAGNLAGTHADGPLFNGLTFAQHISTVDDCDICLIRLGTNDVPPGWSNDLQECLDADYLSVAADCLQHVQYARAAGKRVVLVGTPYTNLASFAAYYGLPEGQACMWLQKARNINTAIHCVSGMQKVPFIATHGLGGAPGQPAADASCVPDGVHPTPAYGDAVARYLADQLVSIFGL